MAQENDDLTACAKALHQWEVEYGVGFDASWDNILPGTQQGLVERARACLRASPLLRDAIDLIDDVYLDAGPPQWHNRRNGVIDRYRKLMEA
jgi:hypothetical protein